MLGIIIAVVVAVLMIAIAIGVYHIGYSSIGAMGTVTGSATIIGTQGLSITLTASGGMAKVTQLNIYDPNGNLLLSIPGSSLPTGCNLYIYNSSGTFTSWGEQVIQSGQSITVNLQGTCNLGTAAEVQVIYNNGRSTTITVGS